MFRIVTFCAIVTVLPHVLGQTPESNNETSTVSAQDIFDLNEEDFQLWLSGRVPKAWGTPTNISTTTTVPSTTTTVSSTTIGNQIDSIDDQTTVKEELPTTDSPRILPSTSTQPASSSNDLGPGYMYRRPENFQTWLKIHMQQSQQVTNQLIAGVNSLPYSPENVASDQSCQLITRLLQRRPGAVSYQSSATIHRFQESSTEEPPFPGSSHHSDLFLSQNQQQKPPQSIPPPPPPAASPPTRIQQLPRQPQQVLYQQQLRVPEPTVIPLRPHQRQRTSEYYGKPAFFRQPWAFSQPSYEAPVVVSYY
ncbi:defective in tip formation protein A-like [Topomyia yanbarensis]|uniref:defective in tip formation protein A-like n=1 Tax=Topomyia yanbarensis TaxID=2498891 RepID=UPI00273BFC9B|nr:defective in tip formation protein A-like [Topomyia yanbarensis]